MNFLITNDDGWGYEGIQALERVAGKLGSVWVVAPAEPMSGISHQMTFERPLNLIEKSDRSFSLDGTPADCVRVALTQLGVSFDWVFSGINRGANLGSDIHVSGTVAAAREASLFGCRAIAFSQHLKKFKAPVDWLQSEKRTEKLLPRLIQGQVQGPIDPGAWINVNFPDLEFCENGNDSIVVTRNDRHPLPANYQRMEDGRLIYRGVYNDRERTPECDVDVCFSGSTSITFHDR